MRKRLIMGILAAIAIGGIVFVFSGPKRKQPGLPPGVESVSPQAGALDLRQITLSADLAPGYQGFLTLDGAEIPQDDVQFVLALNTLTLKPLPGSDYETIQAGRHCASVVYWFIGQSRDDGTNTYQWCFNLH